MTVSNNSLSTVKTLIKALDIMGVIADSKNYPTIAQIASKLNMNRTTVHRLVQTLHSQGYLEKDDNKNAYRIGLRLLPLAACSLDTNKLRIESLPYLHHLAQKSGERVNLGVLFRGEILYLGGVEKPSLPTVYTRFGKKAPAHCCSLGKIILAFLREEEVDFILKEKPLIRLTENTITDHDVFKKHLEDIRKQGYAIDNAEHIPGSYCISALIRDSTGQGAGSISISSGDLEKIRGQLDNLVQTAEIISHLMGYTLR